MSDPYFDDVVLLLGVDGGGGYDASKYGRTMTANGGITDGTFDGVNDYVSTAYAEELNMGTEEFTLEAWFSINSTGTRRFLSGFSNTGATAVSLFFEVSAIEKLRGWADNARNITGTTTITLNVFHHAALVMKSGVLTLYLDGAVEGSVSMVSAISTVGSPFSIGRAGDYNGLYFKGSVQDLSFRLTKGVARYAGAFTPPAAPFDTNAAQIALSVSESLGASKFMARAYTVVDGALAGSKRVTDTSQPASIPVRTLVPCYVTVAVDADVWGPDHAYALDDKVFPTDPITTPYYYKRIASGTSGGTEPSWPTTPGAQVDDGVVTNAWELVERLVQPITHGPLIPS